MGSTRVATMVVLTADVARIAGVVGVVVGGWGGGGGGGLAGDGDGGVAVWEGASCRVRVRTGTAGRDDGGMQMNCGDKSGVRGRMRGSGSGGRNVDWVDHAERPGSCVDWGAEKGADADEGECR